MSLVNRIGCLSLAGSLLIATGCRKTLDVNQNPNVASDATPQLLLPSAEVSLATTYGVNFQIYGGIWGQYWTQNPNSSQYRELERYQPTAPDFDRPWTNLYSNTGEDLVQLEKRAVAGNLKQYQAISVLLRTYMFQVITDAWGDVPYSEALRGLPEDGGIIAPHYDAQSAIYSGMVAKIDEAIALIDPSDPAHPGADDVIYGGDMSLWLKFANTLKLKVLMRLSEKDPAKAQTGIATLSGATFLGDDTPFGDGEDAQVRYSSTAGNKNPLYAEEVGLSRTQNLVASSTVIDSMVANDDVRVEVFFEPTTAGTFVGVKQGNFNATLSPGSYSIPSAAVGADAQDENSAVAPVKLLTGYESQQLQAEAVARGWLTSASSAQDLFEKGIRASYVTYGLDTSDANAYIADSYWGTFPATGSVAAKVRHIVTQKWFSMCGNEGFEGWTEWRRTGYPDFFVHSVTALIPGFPRRFLYPDVEITRNLNFPGTKFISDRVYWDIH